MSDDFPSNSRNPVRPPLDAKAETEPKKLEQVTTGKVVQRKKSWGTKFRETFVSGPDSRSVLDYVTYEIILPAAKDLFLDATTAGLQRKLYGEAGTMRHNVRGRGQTYNRSTVTSRDDLRRSLIEEPARGMSRRSRATHDFGEIVLETRPEAMAVIDMLHEILSKYQMAKVSDLYELVGEDWHYTDQRWGWTSLQGADVQRVNGGYLLILPKTEPLD